MLHFIPGLYQVPQGHVVVLERFGRFEKILKEGLTWVNPLEYQAKYLHEWEGIASKYGYLIELTEQHIETDFCRCNTRDRVPIDLTATIYFKIMKPEEATYKIDVLPKAIQRICLNVLRSQVGQYEFDDIFSKRLEISEKITSELGKKVNEWGINLLGVEVGQIKYDSAIDRALQEKRVAEAKKAAKVVEMDIELKQSEMTAKIQEIEADSKARIQQKERLSLKELAKVIGTKDAVKLSAADKSITAFHALTNKEGRQTVVPSDQLGLLRLLGLEKSGEE